MVKGRLATPLLILMSAIFVIIRLPRVCFTLVKKGSTGKKLSTQIEIYYKKRMQHTLPPNTGLRGVLSGYSQVCVSGASFLRSVSHVMRTSVQGSCLVHPDPAVLGLKTPGRHRCCSRTLCGPRCCIGLSWDHPPLPPPSIPNPGQVLQNPPAVRGVGHSSCLEVFFSDPTEVIQVVPAVEAEPQSVALQTQGA